MTIESRLRTIEQRLDKEGDTKEIRKAFWRIVGKIKRMEPSDVSDQEVEKAAEIRNRLFRQKVVLSVGKGLVIFLFIFFFAILCYLWVLLYLESTIALFIILPPIFSLILLNAMLILISVFVAYGSYPWGRYLGGLIASVKFDGFYRYSPGELGLKIEYTSYLRTTQSLRKWVYGFPILWVFGDLVLLLSITWILNPSGIWAPVIIIILFGVFYIYIYTRRTGELYRFVRELRIAREVESQQ